MPIPPQTQSGIKMTPITTHNQASANKNKTQKAKTKQPIKTLINLETRPSFELIETNSKNHHYHSNPHNNIYVFRRLKILKCT